MYFLIKGNRKTNQIISIHVKKKSEKQRCIIIRSQTCLWLDGDPDFLLTFIAEENITVIPVNGI